MTTAQILLTLRDARVLVLHPRDREGDDLIRQLKRIGCQVQWAWPAPAQLPQPLDAVFFLIEDTNAPLPLRGGDPLPALIAIMDYENPTNLKALLDTTAQGVLLRPIRAVGVLSSLVLALSLRGYEKRLLGKVAKLEETLRTRRDIEKATRILMSLRKISEPDAYQFLRRQATAKRVSIGTIATSVIHASDLLDPGVLAGEAAPSRK
ncbi:MAG: ANTAR domain-containing protein [Acetobacteraceae bacterium]|nr:ANTAR domain-containing protein [Acetobacteraceae bacterium]